ncbi:hypothetical protein MBAV_005891 [Candidatus Magnetobacterium bavaricum]|uniref:Uncharacterized protein n=1 Tax=Candidatus Magnetobacterium bavaricum TaxID=29290 RepID=A0A0F3GIY0_9BACT|nr:hypothetical protein MBAV_005891 [Candidatus Magnetobacterium bavaricum]
MAPVTGAPPPTVNLFYVITPKKRQKRGRNNPSSFPPQPSTHAPIQPPSHRMMGSRGLVPFIASAARTLRGGLKGGRPQNATFFLLLLCLLMNSTTAFAFSDEAVLKTQQQLQGQPIGWRIAFWAEQFIDTPYDPDPLGAYVRSNTIVYDAQVDCMYHTFRSVELAIGHTPQESVDIALDKRFKHRGTIDQNGLVSNYDDRFQYGMDMILSGKWGRDITADIGRTTDIQGARDIRTVAILPPQGIRDGTSKLQSGDIVWFVKALNRRTSDEIVGHLGIIKIHNNEVYLLHASGTKDSRNNPAHPRSTGRYPASGGVKKVRLDHYISKMPFIGILVTRF